MAAAPSFLTAKETADPYIPRPVVRVDRDDKSIPEPKDWPSALYYEFLDNTFVQQIRQALDIPRHLRKLTAGLRARNVNVMDDVPDSSWFTNRIGARPVSPADVERGQNVNPPPAFDREILVTSGKMAGVSPGFRVKDSAGTTWFLKFDPPGYAEMATGAEVVASRILWAAGYNVPELWISSLRRDQLRIDPKAKVHVEGFPKPLAESHLDRILALAARSPDGSYRVVASRELPGKLKGGFRFHGTRVDDPNDLIPHEHRRDLRGLRVICAWINHEDMKAGNTVSSYVDQNGSRFLRHYLWDFGSALGSDGVRPNILSAGHTNAIDLVETAKAIGGAGIWQPEWKTDPTRVGYTSIGRFGSYHFDPEKWKPTLPVIAFENMRDPDAYWAARIIAFFRTEHVAAAVRAGKYSDPEAATYLLKILMQRRELILRRWLNRITAVEQLQPGPIENGHQRIGFVDLAAETGLIDRSHRRYTYQFFLTNEGSRPLAEKRVVTSGDSIVVPPEVFAAVEKALQQASGEADRRVVHLEMRVEGAKPVRAFFVYQGRERGLRLVGFERLDQS